MRFRERKRDGDVELNVTAFLNLMVVLIPFLLLNAVFAQVSVLELNLPDEDMADQDDDKDDEEDEEERLVLEVMIYSDRYKVVDRNSGPLKTFENREDGTHDRAALHEFLQEVKEQFPDETRITLLAEEDTPYELLIHTMDTVRQQRVRVNNVPITRHLFPDVGIGAAPPDPEREAAGDAG